MTWPTLVLISFLALSAAFCGVPAPGGLDIFWCDVEGGAATLIVTPARESLLVDSGWPGDRDPERIAKLAREVAGIQQIDHYITSHWHTDHFGGIQRLAELIPIKNYYDHGFPELPQRDITPELVGNYKRASKGETTVLKPGDEIRLKQSPGTPNITLKVYAAHGVVSGEKSDAAQIRECAADPKHESKDPDNSDNARSLAFVLAFGSWEFFDAGDLTWNVEHKLVCPKSVVSPVDVYQVTHHGMDISNHPALIQALQPRVAVMNNGPKKGGAESVVRLLKSTPGMEALFAVHRNVQTGPEDNAEPALTANDAEQCRGEHIRLSVAPDGKNYTVAVPSKGTTRTFSTR
jgi:beta-lactamase superfamily II metal-dependent hydrolase